MSEMLRIRDLTKRFGALTAVDDISLAADRGEVLGFLGPNGAGKSTTMKMVTGFLPPTSGTAEVCGFDVTRDPIEVKRRVGYLPEGAPLYEDMTPAAFLNFVSEVRGIPAAERAAAIERAAGLIHIGEVMLQPIGTLSKGYKRRVGLAQAIVHDPEVLILDEPTDGLDPNQKHEVRELIAKMAEDKAIVISTHLLEEVEAVCTRAVIISRGRIVIDGTPDDLLARSRYRNAVSVRTALAQADAVSAALQAVAAIERVEPGTRDSQSAELVAVPANGAVILPLVSQTLHENGLSVYEISVERGRLDEVFRSLTVGE
ncbi:MAG: ABC transporter ATP-binding protein [Defluviicoccus sp.]|nr:ABC transporter ATP-binding protein [Defluviicoccus sp.]MDE0386655.1 ABC transporter ATP-binding protein [Defluviicoccus sp.]